MIKTKNRADNTGFLYRKLDFFLFVGLWLWLAIFQVAQLKQDFWKTYLSTLLVLVVVQLPAMAFAWYKPVLRKKLCLKQYLYLWLFCFVLLLPLLSWGWINVLSESVGPSLIFTAVLSSFALELLLCADRFYRKRAGQIKWIKKIRFENAVLMSLVLLAVILSAMAVSSMGNPAYDSPKQLLIGFEFSLLKLFRHWLTFLSFTMQFLLMYLAGYLFFMINSRLLVSKILKQKGLLLYLLSVLFTVALLYPFVGQLLILLPINDTFGRSIFLNNPFTLENAGGAIGIMLISLPVVLALQWATQNNRIVSLEKEKTETELHLLKQQLNPHFFFNTLNNLYALSLRKSDQTPGSILQLSELMRYVIYKAQQEQVQLSEELAYLKDYIELQQMRLLKPLNLTFKQELAQNDLLIAPLLLIVLIENAFKHGIEPAEQTATLNLELSCTSGELYFSCENSVEGTDESNRGGIGLINLTRRLDLLYPGRYTLKTGLKNAMFKAELQLMLK